MVFNFLENLCSITDFFVVVVVVAFSLAQHATILTRKRKYKTLSLGFHGVFYIPDPGSWGHSL